MSTCQQAARPLVRSLRQCHITATGASRSIAAARHFTSTTRRYDDSTTTTTTGADGAKPVDPAVLMQKTKAENTTISAEDAAAKLGGPELGSQRRRVALATTTHVPFELLPYQCFQEARKILLQDREQKIAEIIAETEKIKRIEATDPSAYRKGAEFKEKRLKSLRAHVEKLKILADINDPQIKRRFEDGRGDMSKPIYRYLAKRKWRSMDYKIIAQRVAQFNVVPDILQKFDPKMDVKLKFRNRPVNSGEILNSRVTEEAPTLQMQVFDKGERFFSIIVLDADVPDAEKDLFKRRLHFMAANVPWDPTKKSLSLRHVGGREPGELAVPWLPAFAQKGSPYHRYMVFILEQKDNEKIDVARLKELYDGAGREWFTLKGFRDRFEGEPVGFSLFRSVWDESTEAIMKKHNIPGYDVEFRMKRVHTLKPPRAAKGWEAKRQKPKYKHLWKYTKRIA